MEQDDHPSSEPAHPDGCGALTRDQLELAAIARIDPLCPVDAATSAHLQACRRCRKAVDRAASDHRLLSELAQASRPEEPARPADGDAEIPGYRLGQEIHRGGQGAVFEAEQLATRRRCAVKMLLGGRFASPAQRMRFEREIEVVAALRHPSVVTLYESGISRRGEPWFAMEFVEGERLDDFARRTKPSPREIAVLLRRVVDAIAYAHRRGVIHRDLKPGNVLVDREGVPRVLDFGLARSSVGADPADPRSGSTLAGEFIGTLAYAAPEQLTGDPTLVDSRCDLYALGVLLYELLAGVRPHEGARSIGELVAQKNAKSVRRPSEIARGNGRIVDSDLDVIALRLLDPDPTRRYETADALSEDISRFLDGRPILAREDSVTYVVGKTLRRHWLASALGAVFLLTVIGGSVALAIAYRHAEQERVRVERAYKTFRDALESADPELGGGSSEMNVNEFLAVVERQIRAELLNEPELLAEILKTLGVIRLGFDDSKGAADAILRAYQLISEGHDAGRVPDLQFASACVALAKLRFAQGDYLGAEAVYRTAFQYFCDSIGDSAVDTVDTQRQLASALRVQGKVEEAEELLDDALAHSEAFPVEKHAAIVRAAIRNGRAVLASSENDHAFALAEFTAALETIRPFTAADDFRIGRTLYNMARAESNLGRTEEAEMHARQALEILRKRKGDAARSTEAAAKLLEEIEASR